MCKKEHPKLNGNDLFSLIPFHWFLSNECYHDKSDDFKNTKLGLTSTIVIHSETNGLICCLFWFPFCTRQWKFLWCTTIWAFWSDFVQKNVPPRVQNHALGEPTSLGYHDKNYQNPFKIISEFKVMMFHQN
jgi:hypothetical protein